MRERMHGIVRSYTEGEAISVVLRDELTDESYDLPLTLKTSVPPEWEAVEVRQERCTVRVNATRVTKTVMCSIRPWQMQKL